MSTRTVEKKFKLKPGEEIISIRIKIGSVPVGGVGPRPKREALLTASIGPVAKPKGIAPPRATTSASVKRKAAKAKKKAASARPSKPKAGTGGVGRKPRAAPAKPVQPDVGAGGAGPKPRATLARLATPDAGVGGVGPKPA